MTLQTVAAIDIVKHLPYLASPYGIGFLFTARIAFHQAISSAQEACVVSRICKLLPSSCARGVSLYRRYHHSGRVAPHAGLARPATSCMSRQHILSPHPAPNSIRVGRSSSEPRPYSVPNSGRLHKIVNTRSQRRSNISIVLNRFQPFLFLGGFSLFLLLRYKYAV